jgi:antitoxin component YwqK of YwqJK toxin-antitoxin module
LRWISRYHRRVKRLAAVALAWLLAGSAGASDLPDSDHVSTTETRHWPNGNLHSRGQVIDGLREGRWEFWYQYGQRLEGGGYRQGERHGRWTRWYPNGQVHTEADYRDGVRHGRYVSYYRDGQLRDDGALVGGERDGRWISWLPGAGGGTEVVYEDGLERSRRALPAPETVVPTTP